MKSQILRRFIGDWRLVVVPWLPLFAAAMWYGISHRYPDLWLFAVAMALGIWHICDLGVNAVKKWRQWRLESANKRRAQEEYDRFTRPVG